jgi:hypothetical protein
MRAPPQHHIEQPEHRERHDVVSADATPQRLKHRDTIGVRIAREISGVDSARRCADDATGMLAALE